MSVTAKCQKCKLERGPKDIGPCPRCGHQGRDIVAVINETVGVFDNLGEKVFPQYHRISRDRIGFLMLFLLPFGGYLISFLPIPHSYIFGLIFVLFSIVSSPLTNRPWSVRRSKNIE